MNTTSLVRQHSTKAVHHHSVTVTELQTVGGRGLRLTLRRDTAGTPVELAIESGWLSPEWRPDDHRPVLVPGYLVRDLIDALTTTLEG